MYCLPSCRPGDCVALELEHVAPLAGLGAGGGPPVLQLAFQYLQVAPAVLQQQQQLGDGEGEGKGGAPAAGHRCGQALQSPAPRRPLPAACCL